MKNGVINTMEHAQLWAKRPLFDILPVNFFSPLSSPNRLVYWECLCRLFSTMNEQLSFGVERDILVDELQFYFEQDQAAEFEDDEIKDIVLENDSLEDMVRALVDRANYYGGSDNISVVIISR